MLARVLKRLAATVAASERKTPTAALTDKAEAGLATYLRGPLEKQLAAEAANLKRPPPKQVKLIFGHTHKPFVGSRDVGLARPVHVFNTGGWVVDTLKVEPLHGANIVLVDEALEVACVRMYNQAESPYDYRVRMDDGLPAEQGPLYQHLSKRIDADGERWAGFSAAAAGLVRDGSKRWPGSSPAPASPGACTVRPTWTTFATTLSKAGQPSRRDPSSPRHEGAQSRRDRQPESVCRPCCPTAAADDLPPAPGPGWRRPPPGPA